MTTKYAVHRPDYCPVGSAGNAKRNMYEVGTSDAELYTDAEFEFLRAIDKYKHEHNRPFPTWHEVLQVVLSLGYRKDDKQGVGHEPAAPRRIETAQVHPLPVLHPAPENGTTCVCGS